jgi:hypothetical protein
MTPARVPTPVLPRTLHPREDPPPFMAAAPNMIRIMLPRVALIVLGLITGGFQIIDGTHVLVTGKYIGPEMPGPWRHVVQAIGLDPFALGPAFIVLGACWLTATALLLLTTSTWAWWMLMVTAAMTLWYLPVGTATALATIATLLLSRDNLTTG